METQEPKYFIRFCVERELTDAEFEDMTEIVDDEIGDLVAADEVFEHLGPDGTICYMFQLVRDIELADGDIISYDLSSVWPETLKWEFKFSITSGDTPQTSFICSIETKPPKLSFSFKIRSEIASPIP